MIVVIGAVWLASTALVAAAVAYVAYRCGQHDTRVPPGLDYVDMAAWSLPLRTEPPEPAPQPMSPLDEFTARLDADIRFRTNDLLGTYRLRPGGRAV